MSTELYFNARLFAGGVKVLDAPIKLILVRGLYRKVNLTAELVALFEYCYLEAALCHKLCGGKSRRTRADNSNNSAVSVFLELVALSSDEGIDSTVTVTAGIGVILHAFDTVKAADTSFYILASALHYLFCPVGVCNVRPAKRNHILSTLLKLSLSLQDRKVEL